MGLHAAWGRQFSARCGDSRGPFADDGSLCTADDDDVAGAGETSDSGVASSYEHVV